MDTLSDKDQLSFDRFKHFCSVVLISFEKQILPYIHSCDLKNSNINNDKIELIHLYSLKVMMQLDALIRLDQYTDFLILECIHRNIFEMLIDLFLIFYEINSSKIRHIYWWEQSCLLQYHEFMANKKAPFQYNRKIHKQLYQKNMDTVHYFRLKMWGDLDHRKRWNNKDLSSDCKAIDIKINKTDYFVNCYDERIRIGNWNIHGTGGICLKLMPLEQLPRLSIVCHSRIANHMNEFLGLFN